jgi:hypothetical protein
MSNQNKSTINKVEEDKFSFPKNKKENYSRFLAANKNRVGKSMIDGGLKTKMANAGKVNGKPVDEVIYVGDGCVTFTDQGNKIFMQMSPSMLNTCDGTVSWSRYKDFSGNAYISVAANEFENIAKALSIAAKV